MKVEKKFAFFAFFLFSAFIAKGDEKPVISFGLIADIQYGDCDPAGSRYYRNSLDKLDVCIADFNSRKVDFIVNAGDLADKSFSDLETVIVRLDKLNKRVYNTTGNHDYNGVADNNVLYKKLKMPAEYYSFRKKGWRFIMLNTNEISPYANIKETGKEAEYENQLAAIKASGRKNGAGYNGGISARQMQWLKTELERAEKKREKVIVFSHHPLYPQTALTAFNGQEIMEALGNFPYVKALFAGHHHPGDFAYYRDIPSITAEGMIETEKENAYGIVEIYNDKILVKGRGRMTSRELKIR